MQPESVRAPSFFSLRRLSPFRGTIQVVELADARALSVDGIRWTIQLLSEDPVRETVWGNIGPASSERRYFMYAGWAGAGKLARVPIDPSLGDQSRHPGLAPLLAALDAAPTLPFPPADGLEMWLLDKDEGLRLATVQSARGAELPTAKGSQSWRALPVEERDFHSPRLMQQAPEDRIAQDPSRHRGHLEKLIARTAGYRALSIPQAHSRGREHRGRAACVGRGRYPSERLSAEGLPRRPLSGPARAAKVFAKMAPKRLCGEGERSLL